VSRGRPNEDRPSDESLSAVVTTFESGGVVGRALRSIRALSRDAEIIVVDNASRRSPVPKETVGLTNAKLLESDSNTGFSRACNRGAVAAGGRYLLFLNPDAELLSIPRELDGLRDSHGRLGIVAPARLPGQALSHGLAAEAGAVRDLAAVLLMPYWPRAWGRPPWAFRPGNDWASGACLIVDRREFLDLGGFGERFFLLFEDRELSRRYRQAGLPVREVTGFSCRHELGTSVDDAPRDREVQRRYLCILGLIEYWGATRGEKPAARLGRLLLRGQRLLAGVSAVHGAVAPRSRFARKALVERETADLLARAEPLEGTLRLAAGVARATLDPTGART
jgi:GT2 family glycosyltransferase